MPEGPEVRQYADDLSKVLSGKKLVEVTARTKRAKLWLAEHGAALKGKIIEKVFARGKNIVGIISGGYYFYSHQMMWGRWHVSHEKPWPAPDKRERARITCKNVIAILHSAPIFEVGIGDPFCEIPLLSELGPESLPYPGEQFDGLEFRKRLLAVQHKNTPIGAALLNQTITAGIGNYLRAEILFLAKINPWKKVGKLTKKELNAITILIPQVCELSYRLHRTVSEEQQMRMQKNPTLVYVPGKEYGTRHYVFRRTNLPCLICQSPVRQLRQLMPADVLADDEGESEGEKESKSRIMYFCPQCQQVDVEKVRI